ncbi:Serine/threonine protein kinase sepA [Gracilaria domingensis]|nr:Serine/threonine protein kinase sepA [Gracilaria domingensis]
MASERTAQVLHGREGSYALLEVIGKGAYGIVYKGIWREVGRHVAIKRASRSKLSSEEEKALQTEIQLFKNLKHHHIVNYIEAVDIPSSRYLDIVMEFVEGGSLFNIVRNIRKSKEDGERVFDESVVADFIRQVVLGLDYLHSQGVVHRDIKGANILVTKESHVKLADFGVASTKPADQSSPFDVAGSPYWMAPEIINLTGSSTASDVWSVGCTVIEVLTGFPPYHELSDVTALFRIVSDDCPPLPPNLSAECQDFLKKCFNKDMLTRISARELLNHRWLRKDDAGQPGVGHMSATVEGANAVATEPSYVESETSPVTVAGTLGLYEESKDEDFNDLEFEESDGIEDSDQLDGEGTNGISSSAFNAEAFEFGNSGRDQDVIQENLDIIANQEAFLSGAELHRLSFSEDPFKDVLDDPEVEMERERERRQKEMWEMVKRFAASIGKETEIHVAACNSLVDIFQKHPEQRYFLIYDPGLNPIIEALERGGKDVMVEASLRVTLSILGDDGQGLSSDGEGRDVRTTPSEIQGFGYPRVSNIRRDLCLAGFLPVVMKYCRRSAPLQARLLSARFMEKIIELESTLQMFIACRGFIVFVDMLEPDILKVGELTRVALKGIDRMLSMENQRHKRDFCRRFASCGLLDRIVDGISHNMNFLEKHKKDKKRLLAEREDVQGHVSRLASLLETFAARADAIVKTTMITQSVLNPIIRQITNRLTPSSGVLSILCCIRDLSRDPLTHMALQEASTIETLVQYLSVDVPTSETNPRHFIISSLHNLCTVSPARQEIAARSGLVPHLQRYITSKDMNLRSLCIDMYSGLACAGRATRIELAKHNGADFYVELLVMLSAPGTVRKWQAKVLQSFSEWLDDEGQSDHVETRLVSDRNKTRMCNLLARIRLIDVEAVLEPYLKMVTVSRTINNVYGASGELMSAMVRWLENMYSDEAGSGPRGRLLLLRTLLAHVRLWTRESANHGKKRRGDYCAGASLVAADCIGGELFYVVFIGRVRVMKYMDGSICRTISCCGIEDLEDERVLMRKVQSGCPIIKDT